MHSVPWLQVPPFPFFPQRPAWQRLPAEQDESPVHELKQSAEAASQAYGSQVRTCPVTQVPTPSQVEAEVALPPVQVAGAQVVPA
jgi:hypothetical protein